MLPRLLHVAVLTALGTSTLGAQSAPVRADSLRASRGVRLLELMQSFQMANTPELAGAVNEVLSDTNAHMAMGPRKTPSAADSARAAEIVRIGRAGLEKYKDVRVAEQDGYQKFLPWLDAQSIYHYNNPQNVFATMRAFDATKPVSLLYTKGTDGTMTLVGAMYTGGVYSTPEELDARLPIGIAHWHEHVNFCGPSPDSVTSGAVKLDAASTARWLKITTPDACAAAGGRFVPRLFGWMAHVYLFVSDDPKLIWGGEDRDHMHVHGKP